MENDTYITVRVSQLMSKTVNLSNGTPWLN